MWQKHFLAKRLLPLTLKLPGSLFLKPTLERYTKGWFKKMCIWAWPTAPKPLVFAYDGKVHWRHLSVALELLQPVYNYWTEGLAVFLRSKVHWCHLSVALELFQPVYNYWTVLYCILLHSAQGRPCSVSDIKSMSYPRAMAVYNIFSYFKPTDRKRHI